MPIINSIAALSDEMTAWRQDFHENPELLYEVHRTAGIVAERQCVFCCVVVLLCLVWWVFVLVVFFWTAATVF